MKVGSFFHNFLLWLKKTEIKNGCVCDFRNLANPFIVLLVIDVCKVDMLIVSKGVANSIDELYLRMDFFSVHSPTFRSMTTVMQHANCL